MSKTALPSLNGDDGGTRLNDLQVQGAFKAEADTVVDLSDRVSDL